MKINQTFQMLSDQHFGLTLDSVNKKIATQEIPAYVTNLEPSLEFYYVLKPRHSTIVTMVNKLACGFPTPSFGRSDTQVGPHVKCPLMSSDFNKNWIAQTNLSNTPQHQMSLICN
jgi:hypothetical protein